MFAKVARPPSPLYLHSPVPATVVTIPVLLSTLLTRLLTLSAINKWPWPSNVMPIGPRSVAVVARMPSPLYPPSSTPTTSTPAIIDLDPICTPVG